eukprot:1649953-Heterocapsa_arctica.AAC.1
MHKEESAAQDAVAVEGRAFRQQLEEAKNVKEAACAELREELQEAIEEVAKLQEEALRYSDEDPPTRRDRQRRKIAGAETYLH